MVEVPVPPTNSRPEVERDSVGEDVPTPRKPFEFRVRADIELVANASEEVAIYRFPPWEEKVQCLRFAFASSSESARNALVVVVAEFEIVSFQAGVVVPMPTVVVPTEPDPDATA